LAAFTERVTATDALSTIDANATGVFWRSDYVPSKASLTGVGDSATIDVSSVDVQNNSSLLKALNNQFLSNRVQFTSQQNYVGLTVQWVDRSAPDGYLVPIVFTTIRDGEVSISTPAVLSTDGGSGGGGSGGGGAGGGGGTAGASVGCGRCGVAVLPQGGVIVV